MGKFVFIMEEYIVSARKYRPTSFDTVVGQQALTTTLKNAVSSGKLAHAYLFCGPRGVGKTTCARIFAKAINCLTPTADGEACGQCESCQAFNEQRSFNIFELDAASNNSVEHIKTLMEQTRIPPQVGKYKVFIIDEVHMLSTAAFNAFLKTLEEPPAHVIFILATTEKHKILPTILSRCQIYDFERMTVRDTIDHLKQVAQKEGITVEDEALAFDQAASFCQGNITYQKVIEDLNVLDSDNYFRIVDLALENKAMDIMVLLNSIINKGFDGGLLMQGLAKHVRNVLMARDPQTLPLLEVSDQQRERYQQQAQKCQIPFLYQALRLINQCDINYRQSSNKRLLVELTLIEIAQITQPDDAVGSGRKPRRLKSLFKHLTQSAQPQKAAPQVAAAERVVSSEASGTGSSSSTSPTSSSSTPNTSGQPAAKRPMLKSGISMSFKNVLKKAQPKKMSIIPGTLDGSDPNARPKDEEQSFTQQDLELQWMLMCNRMPQKLSGIATRMKNMNPVITEFPNVEVAADNQIALEQLEQIKGSIVSTLKLYLHNKSITLSLRLAEHEAQMPILSRREQYELMEKENPSIGKLRELLSLELA